MKNTIKTKTIKQFLEILEEYYPEKCEASRRKTAYAMCEIAMTIVNENTDGLKIMVSDAVLSLEQHKKMFRDHIEEVTKVTKKLFLSFKKQGFIDIVIDAKTKKPYLKGRTTMVDEMVVFLNKINKTITTFYKDVYKIQDEQAARDTSTQINLF